jgi:phosphatidylinositol-3-phosphatase
MVLSLALLSMPLKRAAGGSRLVALAAPGLGVQPCGRLRKTPKTYRHVVWVVMENRDYSQIIGSSDAPYINRVARNCGLASNFLAESHPSLPNYIAMTSGSTQGISGDPYPADSPLGVASIFSQLGRNWRALEESMPSNCGRSSQGLYDVNHNPAAYYTNISGQCARQDVRLTRRASLSARFTFVTPNLCHDMHSCPTGSGDNWLSTWLPGVLNSSQYRSGSTAVFVTWDENALTANEHVATIVISPYTRPGTRVARRFTHYSLLRTTEDMLGVRTHLGNAARAASMRSAFHL